MKKLLPCLLGLALLAARPAALAQTADDPLGTGRSAIPAPPAVRADTSTRTRVLTRAERKAAKRREAAADSAKRTERLLGLRLTRPGKAALLAAIAPGAGQIYNKTWWKVPLVYGVLGGVGYSEYHFQSRYREYVDGFNARTDNDPTTQDTGPRSSKERSVDAVQSGIVYYRGFRDIFYLYCALAYSAQIIDALVDAHLKSFDVSDDLSLHWQPALLPVPGGGPLATAPGFSLALRVK